MVTESVVEFAAVDWFTALGYRHVAGSEMVPGPSGRRKKSYEEVVLKQVLQDCIHRLNPHLDSGARLEAFRKITRPEGASTVARNRNFHLKLVNGVSVETQPDSGPIRGAQARIIDFADPSNNYWMVVNQFTVAENGHHRRPDIVVFVNGLPLAVIELKNPGNIDATVWSAWQQIQTYRAELPTLFSMNGLLAVSDGLETRLGTLTAGKEWFKPWRTIEGEKLAPRTKTGLQVLIEGVFQKERFLSLLRDFVVFEDDGSGRLTKKVAGYHQFHAVKAAVAETRRAAKMQDTLIEAADEKWIGPRRRPGGDQGDRRIGVVWHTQGSGKSLTMAFYAGVIIRDPVMRNPTVVVLTDRNDLDNQLFSTFSRCQDLLPPTAHPGRKSSRSSSKAIGGIRRGGVHHHPEVLPRRKRRHPPYAFRTAQHRGDRRRGAPQPIRLPRRVRPAHAGCSPPSFFHRVHRYSHRAAGRQHPGGVRRPHQHL